MPRLSADSPVLARWWWALSVGGLGLLIASGAKRFLLWKQINDLWGASPWEAFAHLHAHALRLLVMQPVLLTAKLGIDADLVFSCFCLLCLVVAGVALGRAAGKAPAAAPAAFTSLALAALPMYGRVVPAFTAVALVLAAGRQPGAWRWMAWVLAFLLGSVSSGTFAVVILLLLVTGLVALAEAASQWTRRTLALVLVAALPVVLGLLALLTAYTIKALRCFEGDPWQLLTQGWGKVILDIRERAGDGPTLVLVAGALTGAGWWCLRGTAAGLSRLERAALIIPVVVGLTGYNSFALIVPPLVLVALRRWDVTDRARIMRH